MVVKERGSVTMTKNESLLKDHDHNLFTDKCINFLHLQGRILVHHWGRLQTIQSLSMITSL